MASVNATERIHGPFQHRNEQRILIAVILARESGHLVDLGIDLFFADQLVVNIFLNVSDSHALHSWHTRMTCFSAIG